MNFIQNLGHRLGLFSRAPINNDNLDKLNEISENIISNDKDFNESPPPSERVRFFSFMNTKKTADELQKEREEFAQREDEFLNPEKYAESIEVSDIINFLTDTTIGKFCVNNSKFVCNSVKKAILGKTDFEADIKNQRDESVILEEDLNLIKVIEPLPEPTNFPESIEINLLSPEATNSLQPLEIESIGIESSVENIESSVETIESSVETIESSVETIESSVETIESSVENDVIEDSNNSIQETSVEPSNTLQQVKKTRKRKKNHITSLTQYGSIYFDLTEIQKNKVLSLLIAKYQEIFNDIRKEYPKCPKFNVWLKNLLENHSLMISCDIRTSIFLNISKELDVLKRNHKSNKAELNKIIELEYLTYKIIKHDFFKNELDEDIAFLKYYSKKRLKAVFNLDFIEENLKDYFKFTFMFLDKIYNHPNNKEILDINSMESKLKIVDLINHPSVNLKISLSSSQIKDQLNKSIKLYQAYNDLMNSILVKMRHKGMSTFIWADLYDDDGKVLKMDEQFSIESRSIFIKNKLNKIESILSNFDDLKDIQLEEYFEIFNNLNFLTIQFKRFSPLIKNDKISDLNEIFQTNSELMTMVKVSQKIKIPEDASKILTLLSNKIYLIDKTIMDTYSYGFATYLIDNNKFNKSLVIPYFDQIVTLIKEFRDFSSTHKAFINDGRIFLINTFYECHTEYAKNIKLNLANEIKDPNEILSDVSHLLLSHGELKTIIKEVVYDEIKRKLAILELEKDRNKIESLKNDLNNLYQLYDSCFEIMKTFNKIFNLYSATSDSVNVKKKGKKQVSPKVVNEILPEKRVELTHIDNPIIEENEAIIKNEDPQIHEIEEQQIDLSHEIQDTLQNPSITSPIKIKKEKIPKMEENRGSKEIFKEFTSLEDEISYASHKKRRHLLQALRDRGWKFDASAGKGSHLKVEGPHGTIQFVPKQEVIKQGTFNSIISSVRQDELENESSTTKKNEPKVSNVNKKNKQRRKQK